MESTRQKKVSRLIQKEMADHFLKHGRDYCHGQMISVTIVRVTPDLSLAKVYISLFPSQNQDQVLENIRAAASSIRYELGQKVRNQLRIVPEINFYIDDSLDYIENIDKLLNT